MARNEQAKKGYNAETREVFFEFANGERQVIGIDSLSDDMRERALVHGLLQKGGDSYAGSDTVEDAVEACKETLEAIGRGDWTTPREGVGAGGADLIQALMRVKGATEEKARAVVMAMDADTRKAVRNNPAVKAVILQIQAEKLAAKSQKIDATDTTGLDALGL